MWDKLGHVRFRFRNTLSKLVKRSLRVAEQVLHRIRPDIHGWVVHLQITDVLFKTSEFFKMHDLVVFAQNINNPTVT